MQTDNTDKKVLDIPEEKKEEEPVKIRLNRKQIRKMYPERHKIDKVMIKNGKPSRYARLLRQEGEKRRRQSQKGV